MPKIGLQLKSGMTPYEKWIGRKPKVHHFRVFGSLVHVKTVGLHMKKLADRSVQMVGYEPGSKAYLVYDPKAKKLHVSRDTLFEEDKEWQWEVSQDEGDHGVKAGETFIVHFEQEQATGEQNAPDTHQ